MVFPLTPLLMYTPSTIIIIVLKKYFYNLLNPNIWIWIYQTDGFSLDAAITVYAITNYYCIKKLFL